MNEKPVVVSIHIAPTEDCPRGTIRVGQPIRAGASRIPDHRLS